MQVGRKGQDVAEGSVDAKPEKEKDLPRLEGDSRRAVAQTEMNDFIEHVHEGLGLGSLELRATARSGSTQSALRSSAAMESASERSLAQMTDIASSISPGRPNTGPRGIAEICTSRRTSFVFSGVAIATASTPSIT